jgi:L,D-transpeptidase catalytic domain
VYAFQKIQGIGVDGVVAPISWSRLASPYVPRALQPRRRLRGGQSHPPGGLPDPFGCGDPDPGRLPGKPSTPTPTGAFSIYRRIDGWRQSPLGLLWRPNYFYRGYALHGSTSVPTYAASHGCVRVTVPAMNRVWSKLFIGERVYVYR